MRIEEEFLSAYDKYSANILKHIYFRVSDQKLAEDMTQEVFLKTWDYIKTGEVKEIKYLKAFLYRVATNLVIDHYRGKSKKLVSIEAASEEGIEFNEISEVATQEKETDFSLDREIMEKYLLELKDEYRQILIYRYIDDLEIGEISKITGKSLIGVRVLIHRALKKLKGKMKNV